MINENQALFQASKCVFPGLFQDQKPFILTADKTTKASLNCKDAFKMLPNIFFVLERWLSCTSQCEWALEFCQTHNRVYKNTITIIPNQQMHGWGSSLCNYITNTGQRWSHLGSPCSREPIQNVDNSISMYFCRSMQR